MEDKYNLKRFIEAQDKCFNKVIQELKNGKKETHWMWFIFPQAIGLGKSDISKYYAIKSIYEAQEYMKNEILSKRMNKACSTLKALNFNDPVEIFGPIDSLKLKSSMTLFSIIDSNNPIFMDIINKFYKGERDIETLLIVKNMYKLY